MFITDYYYYASIAAYAVRDYDAGLVKPELVQLEYYLLYTLIHSLFNLICPLVQCAIDLIPPGIIAVPLPEGSRRCGSLKDDWSLVARARTQLVPIWWLGPEPSSCCLYAQHIPA